jgi:hypothetical protein
MISEEVEDAVGEHFLKIEGYVRVGTPAKKADATTTTAESSDTAATAAPAAAEATDAAADDTKAATAS